MREKNERGSRGDLRGILTAAAMCLLAWPAGAGVSAQETPISAEDAELETLLAETAVALDELAEWCHGERLYLERDRLYEAVLRLDPDHREARRYLKLRRAKNGELRQSKSYKRPKNRDEEMLPELVRREEALREDFRAKLADWGERARASAEELADLTLLVQTDDAAARAVRRETWHAESGRWLALESVGALERRAELARAVAELLDDERKAEREQAGAEGARVDVAWSGAFATSYAHVRTTCREVQTAEYTRLVEATLGLFRLGFGEAPLLPSETTIYVLGRRGDRRDFVNSHPRLHASMVTDLNSLWIPRSSELAIWNDTHAGRVDYLVRHSFQRMTAQSFGLRPEKGWAHEGMPMALSVQLVGRHGAHLTPLDEKAVVLGTEAELWSEVLRVLEQGTFDLALLMRKPVEDLSRDDVVLSYALSRYLLEAQGDEVAHLLKSMEEGMSPEDVVARSLGMDLATLEGRLVRWARETGL